MKFILWKLKIIYHTVYPSRECFSFPSCVHQQLHSLVCQNFLHYKSLLLFTYLRTHMVQGFIFEGDLQFSKLFKKTIRKGVFEKLFTLLPPPFPGNLSPIQNLKEDLHMPHQMYSIMHLSKIIHLSAPLSSLY
jgi:hypothetical protein